MKEDSPLPERARPLRFVFFGLSIVSDWNNPAAITSRSYLRALNELGHETRFLEQRGNQPTINLLHVHGSSPLREFSERYPDLVYRTYDLPKGLERTVWLARELGDVDVVVALDDAPPELFIELARVPLPRLVRVIALTKSAAPPFEPDILLGTEDLPFGPAEPNEIYDATVSARVLVDAVLEKLNRRR